MLKKFFSFYKPHKRLFALDIICSLLFAATSLLYPYLAKQIIDDYAPNKNMKMLLIMGGILLAVYLLSAFLNFIIQYWGHILGVRIQADMRSQLFSHLQKLPFSYFDENKTGSIMSRVVTDLFEIAELAHHGPEDTLTSLLSIIGAFIILLSFNVYLTLILFFIIPFMILYAVLGRRKLKKASKLSREKVSEINASIESSISGIRVSKAYTVTEKEIEKFETANTSFKNARKLAYKSMGTFFSGLGFIRNFMYLSVMVAGGLFLHFNIITVAEFVGYALYINMLLAPIMNLTSVFEQIQDGMTGFVRFQELMAVPPEQEMEGAVEVPSLKGNIVFENVSFSYKSQENIGTNKVINNLNLSIPEGKTIAIVGPSGGGKTTLCHLIPRFYEIEAGTISIDGMDIRKMTRHSLRKNVGIVAQDVFLFGGTIKENIAYGDLSATDEQIEQAAKKANIHDYIMNLPQKYDTQVGERGVKLSGGQKQRISIARAFLKNPPILILDEATSALDNITEMQIQASLDQLSKGRTTIVVAHRLSTIKNADEIIVLTSSGIIERGTHSQLISQNGFYSNLYSFYTE
jgi:ATP-binding cassette subfamily B protein